MRQFDSNSRMACYSQFLKSEILSTQLIYDVCIAPYSESIKYLTHEDGRRQRWLHHW